MAGLVPAIHVFATAIDKVRRGCPARGRAWRVCCFATAKKSRTALYSHTSLWSPASPRQWTGRGTACEM